MPKATRRKTVKAPGALRRKRCALLVSRALQATAVVAVSFPGLCLIANAQPAPGALPSAGVVTAGSATLSRSGKQLTIDQASNRAALTFQSYNVGSQARVLYRQPSSTSVTLNKVLGPDPSLIAGQIDANGRIVLMNPSGVMFYAGAQVDTAGLLVTAASMSDSAMSTFVAGGPMTFDEPAPPNARIENQGNITINDAGLAALVAPQVANSGTITARLGHVVLAGATLATLDLYGDGLLSIDVSGRVEKAPIGPNGAPVTALVTNTGVIRANGGTVRLSARAADGVVTTLVDAGGHISADALGNRAGVVTLNGVGGNIVVAGQLSAAGQVAGSTGGGVEVNTDGNVTVASTARIDASGNAGGGAVAVGTTLARARNGPSAPATLVARNVTVQNGATIAADAISNGDGGHVALLSADTTHMDGAITAKGGAGSGDGGLVETSGKYLGVTGSVNLGAPNGKLGTWLLDPDYLTVVSGAGTEDSNFSSTGTILFNDGYTGTPDTISNTVINSANGDVALQAAQTLTVGADINLNNGYFQNLVLEAGGTLTINPGIKVYASGKVTLATGGAGPGTPAPPPAQASPLISVLGTVTAGYGTISLQSGPDGAIQIGPAGTVNAFSITVDAGTGGFTMTGNASLGESGGYIDVNSAGPLNEATTGTIAAYTLYSSTGISGDVNLLGTANAISILRDMNVTNGDLTVVNGTDMALAGTLAANNMFFEVANGGGTLDLGAPGVQSGPVPVTLQAGSNGRISLAADHVTELDNNSTMTSGIAELAPYTAGSAISLGSSTGYLPSLSAININAGLVRIGAVTQGSAIRPPTAGSINVAGNFGSSTVALDLRSSGAITQSPSAALSASTLTGIANSISLGSLNNNIGTLGNITTTGSGAFELSDGTNLLVNGPLTSQTIDVNVGSSMLTLANGATIATGGTAISRPSLGILASSTQLPPYSLTTAGAYFSAGSFAQQGTSSVAGAGSIMRVNVPGSGNISFSPTGGVNAPSTWLILDTGTGSISGAVNVKALDVIYAPPGGRADLTGTVDGLSGAAAASAAYIQPATNINYLFNGCPIQSINCMPPATILRTQGLPKGSPLHRISIAFSFNPHEENDMLQSIVFRKPKRRGRGSR